MSLFRRGLSTNFDCLSTPSNRTRKHCKTQTLSCTNLLLHIALSPRLTAQTAIIHSLSLFCNSAKPPPNPSQQLVYNRSDFHKLQLILELSKLAEMASSSTPDFSAPPRRVTFKGFLFDMDGKSLHIFATHASLILFCSKEP